MRHHWIILILRKNSDFSFMNFLIMHHIAFLIFFWRLMIKTFTVGSWIVCPGPQEVPEALLLPRGSAWGFTASQSRGSCGYYHTIVLPYCPHFCIVSIHNICTLYSFNTLLYTLSTDSKAFLCKQWYVSCRAQLWNKWMMQYLLLLYQNIALLQSQAIVIIG